MNAAIYVRMSLDEESQSDYSLGAQERACRAAAEAQGWSVVAVYADEGVSGTRYDRPSLQRMLADVRSGRARAVLVHKLDRLARSVRIANDLIDEFQRHGVAFVAVADRIDLTTPFGWAAFQMQNV
jgi:site-specific DNA recombinase